MAKNIVIIGKPGSGKTALATAMAHAHGGRVMSDYALSPCPAFTEPDPAAPGSVRDARYKWDWVRDGWAAVQDFTCGLLVVDELAKKLDARKSRGIDSIARDLSIYFRQKHITVIATAQLKRMFDVIYRDMCDAIVKVEKRERPIIGWLGARRGDQLCKFCSRVMDPGSVSDWCGYVSRDVKKIWWKRLLGYGTRFEWAAYAPAALDDAGEPMLGAKPEAVGALPWSDKLAELYDSQGAIQDDQAERDKRLEGWRIIEGGRCACDAIIEERRAAKEAEKAKKKAAKEKKAITAEQTRL